MEVTDSDKLSSLLRHVGNWDIDFFVFHYRFQIMSPKFPKFERVQNSALKFWISQKQEIT